MIIYTAIFSNYEQLKEPVVITPDWKYICYTDQPFESDIWEIRKVRVTDPRREARKYKALFHHYTDDERVMWIDGSFRINIDLNIFWEKYFLLPFSAPKHPSRSCVYEEINSAVSARRGGLDKIREQEKYYRKINIPANNGIITTGVLLRTKECIDLCEEWWAETNKWSLRDQVSFAHVSIGKQFSMFNWDYNNSRELIYIRHKVNNTTFVVRKKLHSK